MKPEMKLMVVMGFIFWVLIVTSSVGIWHMLSCKADKDKEPVVRVYHDGTTREIEHGLAYQKMMKEALGK